MALMGGVSRKSTSEDFRGGEFAAVMGGVEVDPDGQAATITVTPTYSGCPAMDTMRDDLVYALHQGGCSDVEVRTVLSPAWSSDWITADGRAKLAAAGIAPPGTAPKRPTGPIPLTLSPTVQPVPCPQCGSVDTVELSRFSATACKALRRCRSCAEPFEHVKEI